MLFRMICQTLLGAAALALGLPALAEVIQREDAAALMEQCQVERQVNIEPMRQAAIQDCVDNDRGDRDHCERFYRDLGERTAGGAPAMFWDLPICVKADAAERYFKMNPRSKSFDYQA